MDNSLIQTVTEYMAVTADARELAAIKIASLEKENASLRKYRVTPASVKKLVAKLASEGLVDPVNEAYFTQNISDDTVSVLVDRLATVIKDNPATKIASKNNAVRSPYRVVTRTGGEPQTKHDEAAEALRARLQQLINN